MQRNRWVCPLAVIKEFGMRKQQLLFLFVFTSMAILLAVLVVTRGYASVETASFSTMIAFSSVVGLLILWNRKHKLEVPTQGPDKTSRRSLVWLLAPFAASAVVAFIQGMHEKWNVGDTIGSGFFLLFASLSIYELLRRKRTKEFR